MKTEKRLTLRDRAHELGKKEKHPTRAYNRCKLCGRSHGYLSMFQVCRICFRELAAKGEIVGVKKASW